MTMPASLAGEVEEALSGGDPSRRVEMLRRITRLFLEQAPCLKDQHVEVFDEVILRLTRNLEFRARVSLADQIATVPNAPLGVVRELARDDNIQVAQPVLEHSRRLSDDDLVEIAAEKSQGHLLALSRRDTLPERVTDILVDRGNGRVVRSVAGNEGARFSESGCARLMEKARNDEQLQSVVRARTDMPAEARRELVAIAREKVREALGRELGTDASAAVDAAVGDAAATLERAADSVLGLALSGSLRRAVGQPDPLDPSETAVVAALRAGRLEDALTVLARLAMIPAGMVANAYNAPSYDPLLLVVRSIGFGWSTLKLLLTHKAGRELPEAVLTSAFQSFQALSLETASRVVHFTAVRERAARGEAA